MKRPLLLAPLFLSLTFALPGCITAAEHDREQAYTDCRKNPVKTSRDRCIARSLQNAERDRQQQVEEAEKDIEEAEQRELNRVIAGADK